jgi:hypothetical protein
MTNGATKETNKSEFDTDVAGSDNIEHMKMVFNEINNQNQDVLRMKTPNEQDLQSGPSSPQKGQIELQLRSKILEDQLGGSLENSPEIRK